MLGEYSDSVIEVPDDRLRKVGEFVERCNNLPMWEVRGFAQAYLHGELDLGLLSLGGESQNCGFIISARNPSGSNRSEHFGDVAPSEHGKRARANFRGQQSLVLSNNVELMEGPKKIIPSLVWLQRFDDTSFLGGQGLYKFSPFEAFSVGDSSSQDAGVANDGEVSLVNERLAVAVGESASQNVETATNGVDVCASFDLERDWQRAFLNRHHDIVRGVIWQLFDDHVNVIFEPSIKPLLKNWEIGFGPIDRRLSVE